MERESKVSTGTPCLCYTNVLYYDIIIIAKKSMVLPHAIIGGLGVMH